LISTAVANLNDAVMGRTAPSVHPPSLSLFPAPYRVVDRRVETADVVTISLEPEEGRPPAFQPGQFNMVTAFGIGESAISISSAPGAVGPIEHTVRAVGPVTHALTTRPVGALVGVRGPFGSDWQMSDLAPHVLIVAGGIGLAPLRGVVRTLLSRPMAGDDRLLVLVGARSPDQLLFRAEFDQWRRAGAYVAPTVDVGAPGWDGRVDVVTSLLPTTPFDPARTVALVCGPEVMIRFTARALMDGGVPASRIRVSLERNMQCALGWCGHCQLGPLLLCRDGPVVDYSGVVAELLRERER